MDRGLPVYFSTLESNTRTFFQFALFSSMNFRWRSCFWY